MRRKKRMDLSIERSTVETKDKRNIKKYALYTRYNQGKEKTSFPHFHFSSLIRGVYTPSVLKNNAVVRVVGQCS